MYIRLSCLTVTRETGYYVPLEHVYVFLIDLQHVRPRLICLVTGYLNSLFRPKFTFQNNSLFKGANLLTEE